MTRHADLRPRWVSLALVCLWGLCAPSARAQTADAPSVTVQIDGKVLAGGNCTNVAGSSRSNFVRLHADGGSSESWGYDGSNLTWLRDRKSAEFEALPLDSSTDGVEWLWLSDGIRIAGGWQVSGVSLPFAGQVRARGAVSSSGVDTWQTETLLVGPVIKTQPVSRTNAFGTQAAFYVSVQGPPPFGYQWLKNGIPLADGGGVAGARSPLLTLNNVGSSDPGSYSVTVTNLFGTAASDVATLSCIDLATPPLILAADSAFGFQGGLFGFRISALVGQTCIVETFANLRNWTPVKTNVVTTPEPVAFTDPSTPPQPERYYRVRLR